MSLYKDIIGVTPQTVWKASDVSVTPIVELASWCVVRVRGRIDLFIGYNITEQEGRVSSKIVSFDRTNMVGQTISGRQYKLVGPPGMDQDALYTWSRWQTINNVDEHECVNVTDEYMSPSTE